MATIRALHEQALAGEPIRLETELLRRDGERYDLELRGVPVLHRGEPHVLYIGRDMTQGKRAERALRNSEEQYRAIFNASADGLVVRDAGYRAVDVNPAYLEMSGYTRDEVLSATRVLTAARRRRCSSATGRSTPTSWPAGRCASRCRGCARTAVPSTWRSAACR